jgi:hypothetical protein
MKTSSPRFSFLLALGSVWMSMLASAALCQVPAPTARHKRPAQSGEIQLQEVVKTVSPQENVLAYFKGLLAQLDRLAAGEITPAPKLQDESIFYLTGAYLFCAIRKGSCPFLLDSVLETDIINGRISKNAEAPNMTALWKLWIKNDFQRRVEYATPTGRMRDLMLFRKNTLPRYVKAKETVAAEISSTPEVSDADFFKKRYEAASPQRAALDTTVKFLEAVKEQRLDVFASSGVSVTREGSAGAARKDSAPVHPQADQPARTRSR